VAETVDEASASEVEDEEATDEEAPSVTELLVVLGRDVSVLGLCEAQLAASRNLPEVRRAARDITGAVFAALAFLTAFVFANVAAQHALSTDLSSWLAALVLCVAWLALGAVLVLALMIRAGNVTGWRWWHVFRAGPEESLEELEQARADAEHAVHETLTRLAPAITIEIASASASVAGDVAGDVLAGAGEGVLDTSEQIVEALTEDIPGGSVVSQVWGVVLIPGRFGVKVATTALRRGNAHDRTAA
jgi:hypothetical protein